jgi:hypothetical protein
MQTKPGLLYLGILLYLFTPTSSRRRRPCRPQAPHVANVGLLLVQPPQRRRLELVRSGQLALIRRLFVEVVVDVELARGIARDDGDFGRS